MTHAETLSVSYNDTIVVEQITKKEVFVMERKKKGQASVFLMVVGIIFIVVAGTIFVSTAWRYLPAAGKQGILFISTLLLFLGAGRISRMGSMQKTEAAFYYLGISCLGLFSLSVFGEFMEAGRKNDIFSRVIGWNTEAVMFAGVVMLIPLVLRFARKRTAFDFIMMALLADWVLFWFRVAGGYGWFGGCVISAVGLTVYTLADVLRERWMGKKQGVELAFLVLYIMHGIHFVAHNLTLSWMEDTLAFRLALFIMALFMIGITVLMRIARKPWFLRVFHSIAIYWGIFTGVTLVQELAVSRGSSKRIS